MSMQVIEHIEVGSGGAASITFSSIPADYTDLLLVASLRNSITQGWAGLSVNGNTTNTSSRSLIGDGSSASSESATTGGFRIYMGIDDSNDTANTFHNASIHIPNYTASTAKSISIDSVHENNATTSRQQIIAGLWNDTSAITSLTLTSADGSLSASGNFVQYSSATLYGITAGSDGVTSVS